MDNAYQFLTRWRVKGTCGEVADVLGDPMALVRWWPSVYLDVWELRPPQANGVGRRVGLHTKGWLPYTLRWAFEVVESDYPYGFTIEANGDFDGRGVWVFRQDGEFVDVTYDWRIRAEKKVLRNFSFLLRPLFEANHRWAMAQGEVSLALELERQRVSSDDAKTSVPAPPGPVTYAGVVLVVGVAALVAGLVFLVSRARGRDDD